MRQPRNGIQIRTWTLDPSDLELKKMADHFQAIYEKDLQAGGSLDVRDEVDQIKRAY
jgi:hypothetical protein